MKKFPKAARSLTNRFSVGQMRAAAYILLCLLFFLMQTTPHGFPAPFGARAVLLIPAVVCIAMYSGPLIGGWAGIVIGLFWDVYADRLFGLNALLLLAIGCACGLLVRLLLRNNIMTALLLCIGALITHGLSDWFLNVALLQLEGTFVFLWRITLPNVLYTLLLCPIIYGIFAWLEKRLKKHN